jgi:hypothetical protein
LDVPNKKVNPQDNLLAFQFSYLWGLWEDKRTADEYVLQWSFGNQKGSLCEDKIYNEKDLQKIACIQYTLLLQITVLALLSTSLTPLELLYFITVCCCAPIVEAKKIMDKKYFEHVKIDWEKYPAIIEKEVKSDTKKEETTSSTKKNKKRSKRNKKEENASMPDLFKDLDEDSKEEVRKKFSEFAAKATRKKRQESQPEQQKSKPKSKADKRDEETKKKPSKAEEQTPEEEGPEEPIFGVSNLNVILLN